MATDRSCSDSLDDKPVEKSRSVRSGLLARTANLISIGLQALRYAFLPLDLARTFPKLLVQACPVRAPQVQQPLRCLLTRETLDGDLNRLHLVPRIDEFLPD